MLKMSAYKSIFFFLLFISVVSNISAQRVSLQIALGLMNYGGDLQGKGYTFAQSEFSFGASLMYSINKFSVRAGFNAGKVQGSDSANTGFATRNLSFASSIVDGNLCLQYDIFSLEDKKFTPYIFAGIGVYHFNPYTTYNSQKVFLQPLGTEGQGLSIYPDRKPYSLTQFNVPLGIGVKYKVSDRIIIGFEYCSRLLLTDYLDDVSKTYPDETELFKAHGQTAVDVSFRGDETDPSRTFPSGAIRGNPAHKDNYYTSSITLTYVFPEASSFSNGGGKRKSKNLNCPKRVL